MTEDAELQRFRTLERRHMIGAKDALARGLDQIRSGKTHDHTFLVACVDYLEYIISRFIQQGKGNTSRLREVVPVDDIADHRIIDDIETTLATTAEQLDEVTRARDAILTAHTDIRGFTAACDKFVDFYNEVLAHRKDPAQEIIRKHFDDEAYWRQTNDVTPDSIRTEQLLYQRLTDLAPDGAQPDPD